MAVVIEELHEGRQRIHQDNYSDVMHISEHESLQGDEPSVS
jgi:hypothetical protein